MPASTSARILAALLLVQLAGLIAPFAMIHPLQSVDFITTAAAHAGQIRLAVVFFTLNCALTIGISLFIRKHLQAGEETAGLLLIATGGILFTLQSVDNAHLLSMLSLSERYSAAGGSDAALLPLADVVRSTRRWVHYSTLFAIDAWMFIFWTALLRSRLVPKLLAWIGLVSVMVHFGAVIVPVYLGGTSQMTFAPLMGVAELILAAWLAVKGYGEPRPSGAQG